MYIQKGYYKCWTRHNKSKRRESEWWIQDLKQQTTILFCSITPNSLLFIDIEFCKNKRFIDYFRWKYLLKIQCWFYHELMLFSKGRFVTFQAIQKFICYEIYDFGCKAIQKVHYLTLFSLFIINSKLGNHPCLYKVINEIRLKHEKHANI